MRALPMASRLAGFLLAASLATACTTEAVVDDGRDASTGLPDAGTQSDAGTDGGSEPDGGTRPDGGGGDDAGAGLPADCDVPPEAAGFPTLGSTGVPAGLTLTPGGDLTVRDNGAVIDGRELTGTVRVEANDVVLRNSRITSSGAAIVLADGATRLTIQDVTVAGDAIDHASAAITVWGGEVTIRRLQLFGYAEAIYLNGASGLIEDSFFLCLPDIVGGDTIEAWAGHDLIIRNNRLDRIGGNSNIKFPVDVDAPGRDTRIEGNLLAGGGWSVYGGYKPEDPQVTWSNVSITGNRFSVRHHERSGVYGPMAYVNDDLTSGNVWHESGASLSNAPPPRP